MDISVMVCGGTFSVVYGNSIACNSANEKFSKIVKIFCAFYISSMVFSKANFIEQMLISCCYTCCIH